MHFSLDNGAIPILTTKRVAWKTCLKELLWFIRGDTNNEHLQADGVKKDMPTAFKWLTKAADQGFVEAQYVLNKYF